MSLSLIPKTACAYVRVSTDKQEELSPDAQKRLILEYCKKNNLSILSENIFIENGISGKKADKRPQFQRMIAMAKSKEHPFDVVLVWKFSRFARNQEESIVYKAMLQKAGVEVISISEPIIDGPFGSLIERIIEWMDEYYSIRLSGEVMRGMTEKALRGGYQSTVPLGYKMNKETGIPEIYEPEAEIVRLIIDRFLNSGKSFLDIAREINAMGYHTRRGSAFERRTVIYILENPFYCGLVRWNRQNHEEHTIRERSEWILAPGAHTPIIDKDTFDRIQEVIASRTRPYKSRGTANIKHWLSGIVKCSDCGKSLMANAAWKGRPSSYQCGDYNKGRCLHSHFIKTDALEQAIYKGFEQIISTGDITFELRFPEENHDNSANLQGLLAKINEKERRIKQAYRDGIDTIDEYRENKLIIARERAEIEKLLAERQTEATDEDRQKMLDEIRSVYQIITNESLDKLTRANAIRSVVDHCVYDKEKDSLEIYFYLSKGPRI